MKFWLLSSTIFLLLGWVSVRAMSAWSIAFAIICFTVAFAMVALPIASYIDYLRFENEFNIHKSAIESGEESNQYVAFQYNLELGKIQATKKVYGCLDAVPYRVLQVKPISIKEGAAKCGRWIEHNDKYIHMPVILDDEGNPLTNIDMYYECPYCGRTKETKESHCYCGAELN